MDTQFQIPREVLAQIDFQNTVNGGVVETTTTAWASKEGYNLTLEIPSIDPEKIKVHIANQRFMVYYLVGVLNGEEYIPYYLVNLPLAPEVDIEKITAEWEKDGKLYIKAPFNDWAKGRSHEIDIKLN